MKAVKMATGHNADDVAETVLLNILRGDIARYACEHFILLGQSESNQSYNCLPSFDTAQK